MDGEGWGWGVGEGGGVNFTLAVHPLRGGFVFLAIC